MKIVLIVPPLYYPWQLRYMPQNLGLGYIAAVLLEEGHDVEVIDALALGRDKSVPVEAFGRRFFRYGLDYAQIVERIPRDADMIGITTHFTNEATIIRELSTAVREKFPDTPIVLGGIYASIQPEQAMENPVDYLVAGEGEIPMVELASGRDPESIPGVWYKRKDEIINGGRAELKKPLDSVPFPARQIMPMEIYFTMSGRDLANQRTATMITSRGCPFSCAFCTVENLHRRMWRGRSPENVLAEVDELINKWSVKLIEFEDDNFLVDRERALAILEGIKEKPVKVSFANGLRVDFLDEEIILAMRSAGTAAVHMSIESGDREMLGEMNKKLDLESVEKVAAICKKLQIPIVPIFIVGYPGETRASFNKTLKLAKKLSRQPMAGSGTHIATPYPGTKLYELCKEKGYLDNYDPIKGITFPGEITITTPDFDRREVLYRLNKIKAATGFIPDHTGGLNGFVQWKVKPVLSGLGLSRRVYLAQTAEKLLRHFSGPTEWKSGITFRHGLDGAHVKVDIPPRAEMLVLFGMAGAARTMKVLLGHTFLGDVNFDQHWDVHYIPIIGKKLGREGNLRFEPEAGEGEKPSLAQIKGVGFELGWIEFKVRSPLNFINSRLRKYLSRMPDWRTIRFYYSEQYKEIKFRWSGPNSELIVHVPSRAKMLKLRVSSNRDNSVKVFLNELSLGGFETVKDSWVTRTLNIPGNVRAEISRLRFECDVMIPSESGVDEDKRELGFVLEWYKFS